MMGVTGSDNNQKTVESDENCQQDVNEKFKTENIQPAIPISDKNMTDTPEGLDGSSAKSATPKVMPKSKKPQITKTFVTRARSAAKKLDNDSARTVSVKTPLVKGSDKGVKNLVKATTNAKKVKVQPVKNKVICKKTTSSSVTRKITQKKRYDNTKNVTPVQTVKSRPCIAQRKVSENSKKSQSHSSNSISTTSPKLNPGRKRKNDASDDGVKVKRAKKLEESKIKINSIKTNSTDKICKNTNKKSTKKTIPKSSKEGTGNYAVDINKVIEAINVRIKNSENQEKEHKGNNTLNKFGATFYNLSNKPVKQTAGQIKAKHLANLKNQRPVSKKKPVVSKKTGVKKCNIKSGEQKRKYVRKVPINGASKSVKSVSTKQQKQGTSANKLTTIKAKSEPKTSNKASLKKTVERGNKNKNLKKVVNNAKETTSSKKELVKKNTGNTLKLGSEIKSKPKVIANKTDKKRNEDAASDSDSDQSSTLYSLLIDEHDNEDGAGHTLNNSKAKSPNKKKKQDAHIKKDKEESPKKTSPKKDGSNQVRKGSPKNGSQKSPRKMLLKDSMKSKQEMAKSEFDSPPRKQSLPSETSPNGPMTATSASFIGSEAATPYKISPVAPSQSMSPCAFYHSDSSPGKKLKPAVGSRMPTIPLMPASPAYSSSCTYEKLVKDLPSRLQANRHLKRTRSGSDSDEEGDIIERRLSVRQSESAYKYKEIMVRKCQGYTQLSFNSNTKMKNSLNSKVMHETTQALHNAKFDDSKLVLLSGHGSTFCSGIDLQFLLNDRKSGAKEMATSLREFINTLIAFPKPIVAAVNGPALGLGVAILPLCDIVYASDKATFSMPYTRLAQTPEGCSSYTFPHVMGMAMANEMLLGSRKLTAIEACQVGLVSQVFWPTSMMLEVIPRVQNIAVNSATALEASKILMRSHQRAKLEYTNETECHMLQERWASTDCQRAIKIYLDKELGL